MRDEVMAKHLYGDPMKCTGCRICEVVCSFNKEGCIDPSMSRIKVERFENGEDILHTCRQCEHAPCLDACPTGAIYREKGIVKIDEDICQGVLKCEDACPFGIIIRVPGIKRSAGVSHITDNIVQANGKMEFRAVKCDLCGECVKFCPPGALVIADPMDIARKKREALMDRGCTLQCR